MEDKIKKKYFFGNILYGGCLLVIVVYLFQFI